MSEVEILIIANAPDAALERIARVDQRVNVIDARGWFDEELRATWPQWTVDRYLGKANKSPANLDQRNRVLASAEIVLIGWPPVKNLRARASRLKWIHETPAGASNFFDTDLWNSEVIVTTSRGLTNRRPMAEFVLAAFLHFCRGFHWSYREKLAQRFDHRRYEPIIVRDKTVCVVGAGGIGREVAALCAGAGMRVVGTRRHVSSGASLPPNFARLEPASGLLDLLTESDFVVVSCPWTEETTHLIGVEAFAAMKPGAVLVNIARGEIVDEKALKAALRAGKLRGVGLDVYDGEFERAPDAELWRDERVLITPHVSAMTDVSEHRGLQLFCENLERYLRGEALENVVDWRRGY